MSIVRTASSLLAVLPLLAAAPAHADTMRPVDPTPGVMPAGASSDWRFAVGGGAIIRPEYEGSKDYEADFAPVLTISWRDVWCRNTSRRLTSRCL